MTGSIIFDDIAIKYENIEFEIFMVLDFETFFETKSMDFEVESL